MSDLLFETAKRVYKRDHDHVKNYFRCTVGLKKGKLVSDPSKCGQRPNPKRVRHGRIVAKTRGTLRVKKSLITMKTHASKKIRELNARLNGLFANRAGGVHESSNLSLYMITSLLSKNILMWAEGDEGAMSVVMGPESEDALMTICEKVQGDQDGSSLTELVTSFYTELGYTVEFV